MYVISYTSPQAVLCLNGNLPSAEWFEHFTNIPLIAADGAALQLDRLGIAPDIIIGDLDSFYAEHPSASHTIPILHVTDQNSTDFEKCLDYATENKWNDVLVCGFHGGDLEHSLNNWSILRRYSRRMRLCVAEEDRIAFPVSDSIRFAAEVGELISLVPQPFARLSTEGLFWHLDNEILALGTREGARNRASADEVLLTLHEGEILVFLNARLPLMPVVEH